MDEMEGREWENKISLLFTEIREVYLYFLNKLSLSKLNLSS